MPINELTIFNPTIPSWQLTRDCVSLRVHKTSQNISRIDFQKELNEEFELITITVSKNDLGSAILHSWLSFS